MSELWVNVGVKCKCRYGSRTVCPWLFAALVVSGMLCFLHILYYRSSTSKGHKQRHKYFHVNATTTNAL